MNLGQPIISSEARALRNLSQPLTSTAARGYEISVNLKKIGQPKPGLTLTHCEILQIAQEHVTLLAMALFCPHRSPTRF